MRWRTPTWAALIASLAIAGCSVHQGPARVAFEEQGFRHIDYGYRIDFAAAGRPTFISQDWVVESYRTGPDGWPRDRLSGGDYWHTRYLDVDGDGDRDRVQRAYTYDLRIRHRTTNGMMWVRTFPVSPALQSRELRVLADNYASSVAGGKGYMVAGVTPARVDVRERRFATEVLDTLPMRLDGREAFGFIMDVADVDQLRLSRASRLGRAAVVLVRTSFGWRQYSALGTRRWPVLMVIGYVNGPDDFAAGLDDFERFLASFRFPERE